MSCADPECNGADPDGAANLDPWGPDSDPKRCRPPVCPTTWHVDLQAYWQFEETTNDTVGWNDTVGNPNHGVLKNGAGYTSELEGRHGKALDLTSSDAYMEVPNDDSFYDTLNPGESFTMAAWIKTFDAPGDYQGIMGKKTNTAYHAYVKNNSLHFSVVSASGNRVFQSGGTIKNNTWQHVAVSYDKNLSSDNMKWYVNGTLVHTADQSGNVSATTDPFTVGYTQYSDEYFHGRLDQVRLYHRALNTSEIAGFVDHRCGNRQRSQECYRNPELCDTPYSGGPSNYHCNYGNLDNPNNTQYDVQFGTLPSGSDGTGICCPKDQDAVWKGSRWGCTGSNTCGIASGDACQYNITNNESAWFGSRSNGTSNACNSQIPRSHENLDETSKPEGSQACCYVPKDGVEDYWYKDGNVRIYG